MRATALPCLLVGLTLAAAPASAAGPSSRAARYLAKAERADAALRGDPARLRFRHHLELVIKRWQTAARLGRGQPELHLEARAGEVRAWALLARYSGRASDRAKAKQIALAFEAELAAREAPSTAPDPSQRPEPADAPPVESPRVAARPPEAPKASPAPTSEPATPPAVAAADALSAKPETPTAADAPLAGTNEPSVFDGEELAVAPDVAAPPADTPIPANDPKAIAAALRDVLSTVADEVGGEIEVTRGSPLSQLRLRRSTRAAARPREADLLQIRRVVIDAGHGGEDHGAVGPGGLREADVNLSIAKRLGAELQTRLGVEVVYTRTDDTFVSLADRSRIANRHRADLFVSVHANAHRKKRVHGIETYYLNTTSNRYARRLARRENRASAEPGGADLDADLEPTATEHAPEAELPGGELGQDLRLILADLAMRSATVESRRLAGYVQSEMVGQTRRKHEDVKDLGVKHALFYVLLGARMPAVLVETGFISHAVESQRLARTDYQQVLAQAIASGVARFVAEREELVERLARSGSSAGASTRLAAASP